MNLQDLNRPQQQAVKCIDRPCLVLAGAGSLTLRYAKTRQKFGDRLQCEASRFLYELPEADLEGAEHTLSKLSEDEKHQRGLDTFADLKALLSTAD